MHNSPKSAEGKLAAEKICIIVPTKGRHKQLNSLLETLSHQTHQVGKIIIADGGRDAEQLVVSFRDKLPVKWLDCEKPGQIAQRNHALNFLPDDCVAVAYFDDDLQLKSDAFEKLILFWNSRTREPGGISLNITNVPKQPDSFFRHVFFMPSEPLGRVWRSGYNSPISNLKSDLQTQWLLGGATIWRRDIIEKNKASRLPSDWAICEDLIFSYPISKKEDFYVCANAITLHVDELPELNYSQSFQRNKSAVLWRYFFVSENEELSKIAFFWMCVGQLMGRAARILRGRHRELGPFIGTFVGMTICLKTLILSRHISTVLEK